VTVYLDDDEAFDIWHNVIGLPEDRIHRLGEDKNYWPANAISKGPNGPCGPCSEIFYRVAPPEEMTTDPALTPTQHYLVDDAAGRWVEIWNNVFTQFDRTEDEHGKAVLTPLPKKNNDTGAGLDRIAYVSQGRTSVFETDLFAPTLQQIEALSGKRYTGTDSPIDFAFRVVAEHTRSMVFCISDGIFPSNEGAGYVLRYIMRRAIRYGKTALGFEAPFLHEVAPKIIAQMGDFYPELRERCDLILQTIRAEEESFRRTLDNGMRRLEEMLAFESVQRSKLLSGRDVFKLHDTYGLPANLTRDIAVERGIAVDLVGFEEAMEEQRQRSRESGDMSAVFNTLASAIGDFYSHLPPTEFVGYGYNQTSSNSKVLALISGTRDVESAQAGENVRIVLDRTPFYAEAGGQVGDIGLLTAPAGNTTCALKVEVRDTHKNAAGIYLHSAHVLEGEINTGQTVHAMVDAERRRHIMRNHTATHLLQAALREVLGGHVHQKGSLVSPERLRFDFTHAQPVTPEEIKRIEETVNRQVLADTPVVIAGDVPIADARARGAMALFGEKYGDRVRIVEIPKPPDETHRNAQERSRDTQGGRYDAHGKYHDARGKFARCPPFSLELCGGTHLAHTSQVGLFKILSETGVAAGVRRIEAVTGQGAFDYVNRREETLAHVAALLKSHPNDVVTAAEHLIAQRQELERQNRQLKAGGGAAQAAELTPRDVQGVPVVVHKMENADAETVANLADRTAQRLHSAVIVLGAVHEGKVAFAAKVTRDLVEKGLHAGNLVREVARIAGGGGGGRPDFAQAGGRDPGKLDEALNAVPGLVETQLAGHK
jgi:alanyl-tRNA synthetase